MKDMKRRDKQGRLLKTGEFQKKDGRYEYKYTDIYGKRRTLTAVDLKTLREKEDELNKKLNFGLDVSRSNLTLNDYYPTWIKLKESFVKKSTLAILEYTYNCYIRNTLGSIKVKNIRKSDIKMFYADIYKNRNYKLNYLKQINKVIHNMFTYLVDDEVLLVNPADNALKEIEQTCKGNTNGKVKNALSVEQQDLLVDFLNNSKKYGYIKLVIFFLLYSGTRCSEMAGLTWDACDFENKWIYINKRYINYAKPGVGNVHDLDVPKTEQSNRRIPMLDTLEEILLEQKEICEASNLKCKITIDGVSNFVFLNEKTKKPISSNTLNRILKRIVKECNKEQIAKGSKILLPETLSTHTFRHTYSTRMNEHNANVRATSALLGHAKTSITYDTYTDIQDPYLISQASKLYD